MKIIILVLTAILYTVHVSSAQNYQWVRHHSHNILFNPEMTLFVSCADNEGNSLLGAIENYKLSYNGYYGDVSLKKFDENGVMQFNKIFYGKVLIKGMDTDLSRNIYLYGSFMDTLRIDPSNIILNTGTGFDINYFLIKLTPAGDLIWKKNINVFYPITVTIDALKIKNNDLFISLSDFNSGFIKKHDLDGNESASISLSPVRGITGLDVDMNGNIFAAGSCSNGNINFNGHTSSTSFFYNVYLVKFNSSGNYLWSNFIEDITFQSIDIATDSAGNLYSAGDLSGDYLFGNIQTQGPQWVYDFFLTKIDQAGNFLWVKEVPNTASITGDAGKANVNGLSVDNHSNVYFTGFLRGTINWGKGIVTSCTGSRDILLLKFDQNGNIVSGKAAGGNGDDRSDDISCDNNGNVYVSGNFSNTAFFDSITVAGSGYLNSFITKLTPENSITVLNLSLIVEGFYNSQEDIMSIKDTFIVYLRNSVSPYAIIDSSESTVDSNTFTGVFEFVNASSGLYYIQLNHRNSIETCSGFPVNFNQGDTSNFSFISSSSQAFGSNMPLLNSLPVRYGIFSGDISKDGIVDAGDLTVIDNDTYNFASGYIISDLTGDGIADAEDAAIADNNALNFVSAVLP